LFRAGDQSGDRTQDDVEVVASAEMTSRGPPVGQVADAVLHAESVRSGSGRPARRKVAGLVSTASAPGAGRHWCEA
jgi:hypothetical protein